MAKRKTIFKRKAVTKKLHVMKSKKGLVHRFDIKEIESLAQEMLQKHVLDNKLQFAQSMRFEQLMKGQSFDQKFLKEFDSLEMIRICFGGLDPLSVAGNLAAGGRFNIGGAQVSQFFNYDMAASIYGACSLECAKDEVGIHMNAEIYAINTLRSFKLWDLNALIASMDNSASIYQAIDVTPLNMQWKLQKFPATSQILASMLRSVGGDGIFFPSTKHANGTSYCFFIKDEKDAKSKLKATRLVEDQLEFSIKE